MHKVKYIGGVALQLALGIFRICVFVNDVRPTNLLVH